MAERQVTFVDTGVLAYAHDRSETRKQPVARPKGWMPVDGSQRPNRRA